MELDLDLGQSISKKSINAISLMPTCYIVKQATLAWSPFEKSSQTPNHQTSANPVPFQRPLVFPKKDNSQSRATDLKSSTVT